MRLPSIGSEPSRLPARAIMSSWRAAQARRYAVESDSENSNELKILLGRQLVD